MPWLVARDNNEIRNDMEKQGGAPVSRSRCNRFNQMIEDCNLIVGFQGSKFTWTNSQPGLAAIRERLDQALCNNTWRSQYPEAWVKHLPRTRSDHCLLLVHLENEEQMGRVQRPFRTKAA
ncbi:uncharacterized protein LOC130781400 [Actinidia eriantha]|uniref:uncharacterized protein LOC130781400 n=1 Tax=Actinidia eriantha TaxID=165200 RepID=UPI002588F789|nr:uncharacterized protein LOC130781400 [Actinidia eriantha]